MNVLLKYLLGTDLYKKRNKDEFISMISVDDFELFRILRSAHLFLSYIKAVNDIDPSLLKDELALYQTYQSEIREILLSQINVISEINHASNNKLILLKGLCFSNRYYDNSFERKVGDIDILIELPSEYISFEIAMIKKGFIKHIVEDDARNYNWSLFSKGFTVRNRELFERYKCRNYRDREFYLPIDVHKKPFLLKGRELSYSSYFISSPSFPNLYEFTNSFNIVYISIKIYVDIYNFNENHKRSISFFKLLKDFIQALKVIDQQEFTEAQNIARYLNVFDEFMYALSLAKPLVPEVSYLYLEESDDELIDHFISQSLEKEKIIK